MKHARDDYNRIQDPELLIPKDEPVFLIRGQDLAGPATLYKYAELAKLAGASTELVNKVRSHAKLMQDWQRDKARKIPDL